VEEKVAKIQAEYDELKNKMAKNMSEFLSEWHVQIRPRDEAKTKRDEIEKKKKED